MKPEMVRPAIRPSNEIRKVQHMLINDFSWLDMDASTMPTVPALP
jgi:hypothetical protein